METIPLEEQKTELDIQLKNEREARTRFNRLVDAGHYVLREDLDRALAERGAVLDSAVSAGLQAEVNTLIRAVDGEQTEAAAVLALLLDGKDDAFNTLADPHLEWHVKPGKGGVKVRATRRSKPAKANG